jgi:hypothetical protein
MAFSTSPTEKRGFQLALIFNGLQLSKMSARPCAGRRQSKNCVFQQPARERLLRKHAPETGAFGQDGLLPRCAGMYGNGPAAAAPVLHCSAAI